jgi:cysteine synthase A
VVANARRYKTLIMMPDTLSREKKDLLWLLGPERICVPTVPYETPDHCQHAATCLVAKLQREVGAPVP